MTRINSDIPARAARRTLIPLSLVGVALLAGACSIEVNGETDLDHNNGYYVRTPTDLCRREVNRSFADDYRIDFDLPELSTQGTVQTVVQRFTMTPRQGRGATESRTIQCTVTDRTLTEFKTLR